MNTNMKLLNSTTIRLLKNDELDIVTGNGDVSFSPGTIGGVIGGAIGGTAGGAAGGAAVGALFGSTFGPIGTALGAIFGAISGFFTGSAIAQAATPSEKSTSDQAKGYQHAGTSANITHLHMHWWHG